MKQNVKKNILSYSSDEILNRSIDYFGADNIEAFHYGKYYVSLYKEPFSYYLSRIEIYFEKAIKEIMEKFSLTENNILIKYVRSKNNNPLLIDTEETEYFFKIRDKFFFSISGSGIYILHGRTIPMAEIKTLLKIATNNKMPNTPEPRKFYMVTNNNNSLSITDFDVKKMDIDINDNYNDDFLPIHNTITTALKDKYFNGMFLLHGLPGSGKTTYLRSLISNVNARFIYLPAHMISSISSPAFMPFLMQYKNSVLILEDCEEIIMARDNMNYNNSAIVNLLNLGDGLLADALSIKVICTFNTDLKNVDKALLRKGRLIARYEFKEMELKKAQILANKIGCTKPITKPTLLSDIYNWNKDNNAVVKQLKKIGY